MSFTELKSHTSVYWLKLIKNFKQYPIIGSTMVFGLVFLLYLAVYLGKTGVIFVDDHFFHFKYAYLIRTQGWEAVTSFKWLAIEPGHRGIYQITLYNLALIPFTYVKDMALGLRISDIFWASLSISTIYYSFRKFKLVYPLFWILMLLSVTYFAERMMLGRALVLVPAFLMLEIYFAKEKKYFKFFLTSLLHVAWHTSTFFLPLVMAILVEAARILAGNKFYWKNITAAILGFFAGIKLTLYSIVGLIGGTIGLQLLTTKSANKNNTKIEGGELYPVDIFKMIINSEIFLMLLIFGFAIVFYYYISAKRNKDENTDREDNVLLYCAFLFALMSFAGSMIASGRFYDYYFVSIVFLTASVITVLLKRESIIVTSKLRKYIIMGFGAFFFIAIVNCFLNINHEIKNVDNGPMQEVTSWIAERSNEDDRIFLNDWGMFPVAFFYNSKNIYNVGIEPSGSLTENPELYWKWYNILVYRIYCEQAMDCKLESEQFSKKLENADKEEKEQMTKENSRKIIESIKNDFGSHYVIASLQLANILDMNPDMIEASITRESDITGSVIKGYEFK